MKSIKAQGLKSKTSTSETDEKSLYREGGGALHERSRDEEAAHERGSK